MKKVISSCLIVCTICFSTPLRADTPANEAQTSAIDSDDASSPELSTTPVDTSSDPTEDEGTPVGQAASEGSKTAKRRQWRNIALATVAVALAVTALVLVANNNGHRSDD